MQASKVGILAVQGAFEEHFNILKSLGAEPFLIRKKSDILGEMDALILPGGESTVQGKLLRELDLFDTLKGKIESGLPVMGTCAGMILLAKKLKNDSTVHFGLMDIEVMRNAYGRQLGSFNTKSNFGNLKNVEMTFIRAPYITYVSDKVDVLSEVDGNIVAAREKNMLAISFHPELTNDKRVHEYFLNMIK